MTMPRRLKLALLHLSGSLLTSVCRGALVFGCLVPMPYWLLPVGNLDKTNWHLAADMRLIVAMVAESGVLREGERFNVPVEG